MVLRSGTITQTKRVRGKQANAKAIQTPTTFAFPLCMF